MALVAALALLAPGAAQAQIFTPSLAAPVRSSDTGLYLTDGFGTSDGLAVEGIWRRGFGIYDLGLRAGLGEALGGLVAVVGADYRNPLELGSAPLAIAATGGAQAALGEASGFGLSAGLSLGGTFRPDGLAITPYLHPRIALVETLRAEDDPGLEILADVGVDLEFGTGWIARLGLGLGSPTADFSLGLAWR